MSDADALAVARRVLRCEAEALSTLADGLDGGFARAVEVIAAAPGRVVCTGVGKSGHVGRKIAATLASTGTPAIFVHATEASHGDLGMIGAGDVVLALSRSGETRELADVVAYCARFAIPLLAATCATNSTLAGAADVLLALPDLPEAASGVDAPTTSTTLQMALGDALAVALLERRGFTPHDFRAFHPGGKLGAALRTAAELMHAGAELPLASEDTCMREALLVMTEKRFGVLGVVDAEGRLAGVVTDGDLRRHMDGLLAHTAAEVMTHAPLTLPADALAGEALRLMNERGVTVLFVTDVERRPQGVLHIHDLLRAGVA
ncbi:MAG: KpsF/GutQ family sugar-phosphate isomerase [Caulobacteraceae bacterium]|nr:KpsF/GutQ family sugar-phosphate isomerase [Caulobacter sp.]